MKRLVNRLSGACLYVLLALIVGMSSCEDDANDWTVNKNYDACLLYTSPSPRDGLLSRMPSSA